MLAKLLLLFTLVPLTEFFILYYVSRAIGSVWVAVGLVIVTGAAGAALAKHQGIRVITEIRKDLSAGVLPGDKVLDGLIILVASALLITPGLLTDLVGLCMLIPPLRRPVRRLIQRRLRRRIEAGKVAFFQAARFGPPQSGDREGDAAEDGRGP